MAKINKVIPGKELPKEITDVTSAIEYGNRMVRKKMQEKEEMREIQNKYLSAGRPGQGADVLEPFNFTTVLRRLFTGEKTREKPETKKQQPSAEDKGRAVYGKPEKGRPAVSGRPNAEKAKGKEPPEKEEIAVQVDENGAVVEEKAVTTQKGDRENMPSPRKTITAVNRGTAAPRTAEVPGLSEDAVERTYANIVIMGAQTRPRDMRLGKHQNTQHGIPGAVPYPHTVPSGRANEKKTTRTGDPQQAVQRDAEQRRPEEVVASMYKPEPARAAEELDRTPKEQEAERKVETELMKAAARTTVLSSVISGAISRELQEKDHFDRPEGAPEKTTGRKREPAAEAERARELQEHDGEKMRQTGEPSVEAGALRQEPVHNTAVEQARALPQPEFRIDTDAILMSAAKITHSTGREMQFDKGHDQMQIRREGAYTNAYINGKVATPEQAKGFMKQLSAELGPAMTGQLSAVVGQVIKNPGITMAEVVSGQKAPAAGAGTKDRGMSMLLPER